MSRNHKNNRRGTLGAIDKVGAEQVCRRTKETRERYRETTTTSAASGSKEGKGRNAQRVERRFGGGRQTGADKINSERQPSKATGREQCQDKGFCWEPHTLH